VLVVAPSDASNARRLLVLLATERASNPNNIPSGWHASMHERLQPATRKCTSRQWHCRSPLVASTLQRDNRLHVTLTWHTWALTHKVRGSVQSCTSSQRSVSVQNTRTDGHWVRLMACLRPGFVATVPCRLQLMNGMCGEIDPPTVAWRQCALVPTMKR